MFIDKAKIYLKAGDGGNGSVSFRAEKYVPNGGPDGGDGGRGGNIVFFADPGKRTLADFRFKHHFKAEPGGHGQKKKCYGKDGEDLNIAVPVGTIIRDVEMDIILADLSQPNTSRIIALGGRGGKGNVHFKTAVRQAPHFATEGRKGDERWVVLELKTIADVGLIGYPNVGKSTLLSVVSSARPKIGDYHFTTLAPNLGVVSVHDDSFIMADIPGIIEGAHEGMGLGHEFLRHVERTRLLVHVLDGSGREARRPIDDYRIIRRELHSYSEVLAERPEIVAINKSDVIMDPDALKALKEDLLHEGATEVFVISAATHQGIQPLLNAIIQRLKMLPESQAYEEAELEDFLGMDNREPLRVDIEDGVYMVTGSVVERLMGRVNLSDSESLRYFQRMLRQYGVIEALKEAGAGEGDSVCIGDMEFDFIE